MNSFRAVLFEHVFEFANKAMGAKTITESLHVFLIVLINAPISYVSRVVLLLPIVPVATTNVENIKKILSMKTTPVGD